MPRRVEIVEHLVGGRRPGSPASAGSSAMSAVSKLLTPQCADLAARLAAARTPRPSRRAASRRANAADRGRCGRSQPLQAALAGGDHAGARGVVRIDLADDEEPRRAGPRSPRRPPPRRRPRHTSRRCRSGSCRDRGRASGPPPPPPRRAASSPICQVPWPSAGTLSPSGSLTWRSAVIARELAHGIVQAVKAERVHAALHQAAEITGNGHALPAPFRPRVDPDGVGQAGDAAAAAKGSPASAFQCSTRAAGLRDLVGAHGGVADEDQPCSPGRRCAASRRSASRSCRRRRLSRQTPS